MRGEWKTVQLGDVCTFTRTLNKGAALPYVGLEDIVSGEGRFTGNTEPKKVQSVTFKFTSEHILYGRLRPYLNKVYLPDFDGHCSTEIFPIRPAPNTDRRYLYYWLSMESTVEEIDRTSTGARMPRANMDAILEFAIALPPLSEQRRIVAILDEAFAGLATATANAEKNLRSARELFNTYLHGAFDEQKEQVRLQTLATEITDGDHSPPPKAASGVPFITISNIVKETREIDFSDTFFVPRDYFERLKSSKRPIMGDILYTVTGATLGIPVLVREQLEFCFQRHIGLIRPRQDVDSSWLCYALVSPNVYRQATLGSTGAAQKTVSLSVLRNIEVPKQTLAEQRTVAAKLDDLFEEAQRLGAVYRQKIKLLTLLKQSILQKAFSGALTSSSSGATKEAAE